MASKKTTHERTTFPLRMTTTLRNELKAAGRAHTKNSGHLVSVNKLIQRYVADGLRRDTLYRKAA